MQKNLRTQKIVDNSNLIDFSVPPPNEFEKISSSNSGTRFERDMTSIEDIMRSAETNFRRQDFEAAARLIESTLSSMDKLYSKDGLAKINALLMLRDSYLIKNDVIAALDCVHLTFMIFEEIIANNAYSTQYQTTINPKAFAKPVVRKLKTLRRSKASEALRKRALLVSEKWKAFCKTT
jgi:plasmid maintenance system killer protein